MDSEMNPEPAEVDNEKFTDPITENTQDSDAIRQEVDMELNLKSGSLSLGLSFVVEEKGDSPRFDVCMTWARYMHDTQLGKSSRMFRRKPNFSVYECPIKDSPDFIVQELKDPGVHIHVIKKRIKGTNRWVVKVFLENRTTYDTSQSQTEEHRIFQPQIRVRLRDLTLSDLDSSCQQNTKRYESDDLLYLKYRTKARGYLCAAVWDGIDPEQDMDSPIAQMSWPDSSTVPEDVRDTFTHPDVRTEYLPMYTILQPDQDGRLKFDASALSQTWNSEDLGNALKPIVHNYSEWIDSQRTLLEKMQKCGDVGDELKKVGEDNLQKCVRTNQRIMAGIDFLTTSERARAAFCFMNVVMNDKRVNEEGEALDWREFQMAFILQNLRGVAGESKEERDVSDVLWFPTGGGKTEAYLGIVIFAIAYRRLSPSGELSNDGGVSVISRYTLRLLTIQQFQRALGAIVAADIRRVENWVPADAESEAGKISDPYIAKRLKDGMLWGGQRFSIGMWIGTATTPKDFCYTTGRGGKVFLNAEGALLPQWADERRYSTHSGDPTQVRTCPICKNILCLQEQKDSSPRTMTWIVNSPRSLDELQKIPKEEFEYSSSITLDKRPIFDYISDSHRGRHYYRLTMEIKPTRGIDRQSVDSWWRDFVKPQLDPDSDHNPLESTSPSMPGYFFIEEQGSGRPHDFAIFCTNKECKLNKTEWFEKVEDTSYAMIPKAFQINGSATSRSVPISAFVTDEQIYFKCPSLLIATVDKFANLPFEPKCASLFGNVDVIHPVYGYGRRATFEAPRRQRSRNERIHVSDDDLHGVTGFSPPSLILQDELHLIEGPLGSMVGVYEMAVDVLCSNESRPKYIASSATIKESKSQVGTIFRRDVTVFPPPGIDAHDNYFSKIEEDVGCASKQPGRLYLGMSSTKSTVTLPIKAQSWIMSEIFRIKSNPSDYGLTDKETSHIDEEIEPYWTFVSYFTDLQILAKFTNYYSENIRENVSKWSPVKMQNSQQTAPNKSMEPGLRLFALEASRGLQVHGITIHSAKNVGRVKIAMYKNGDPIGEMIDECDYKDCRIGEIEFELTAPYDIRYKEKIWIAVINDDKKSIFESVSSDSDTLEDVGNKSEEFPKEFVKLKKFAGDPVRLSINSAPRQLLDNDNIQLSSETRSEDLAQNLERLKSSFNVDSLQTSPVFGTGIDVDRLGLMEIMNQPKTSSGYIQSSGRVGRTTPGLVINWLRAGRARDLNHYENFVGYHRMLHKFVEPVTASPFANETIKLCLGPIIVAILRNARSVSGHVVNAEWISEMGPNRMSEHHNDPEIGAIAKKLECIASSEFIAEFRQMPKDRFRHIFDELKGIWRQMATSLHGVTTPPFVYAERQPNRTPSSNVILGTPNHADLGLDFAYEDVPNSLRQTESTSTFYKSTTDTVQIRPSQFITRYGPGTLISRKTSTWVIPPIRELVSNLTDQGNFEESDAVGARRLYKYEVNDSRMKRIIRRFNPNTSWEKLRFFSLPSNSSLTLEEIKPVYRCDEFPKWGICHNRCHPTKKILGKTSFDKGRTVIECPECERILGDKNSTEFYSVRYVVACKNGHLGDLNWKFEVHQAKGFGQCKGDIFEWITSGSNDNVEIVCMGHWNTDKFIPSTCGARTTYIELKRRSNEGQIDCGAEFVESGSDSRGCPRINKISQAKMISKTQMSIRLPIITTTMEIQRYKGILFERYVPLASRIDTFVDLQPEFTKDEFIGYLESKNGTKGINNQLIRQTRAASEDMLRSVIDEIREFAKTMDTKEKSMTEYEALEEELSSLENQTRDNGTGVQIDPKDQQPTDIRFPISISSRGLNLEIMPFGDIKVTQVQSGYTREISPPTPKNNQSSPDTRNEGMRIGDIVSCSEKFTDENDTTWYLANQLKGEGIFIHLDPKHHHNAADVFRKVKQSDLNKWESIHKETVERNNVLLKHKRNEEGAQKDVDALEMGKVFTNPLFVWWHSFAHGLINQLAIDSGFMGVSLGERIYLRKRDGKYTAGIFIYAATPGADGTLGGLISLVNEKTFAHITERTLERFWNCSNDPICMERHINDSRRTGAACHICLMNSETSCSYRNRFLDRNMVMIPP